MPFKRKSKIIISLIILSFCILAYFTLFNIKDTQGVSKPRIRSSSSPKAEVKTKAARQEYFHRLLRDPKTDQIPPRMRQHELEYAQKLRESRPDRCRR
jgi:hypothetical protein